MRAVTFRNEPVRKLQALRFQTGTKTVHPVSHENQVLTLTNKRNGLIALRSQMLDGKFAPLRIVHVNPIDLIL